MKVTIVGPAWPFRGGIAAFSERLARQLIAEGHEVTLYTFTLQYPSLLFPGKTQYSTDPAPEGLTIHRCFSSINPFSWLRAGRRIRREQPGMVIFAYWMSFMAPCFGTIAACVRKAKGVRCIGLMHNMIPHEPNILDKLFPRYFVRRMDGFLALSQAVANDIRTVLSKSRTDNKPIAVTPHPLYDHYGRLLPKEEARHTLGLEAGGRYVLFFGFIRAYKGLDLLLEAMADPRLAAQDVRLIVAGEFYEDESRYQQLIDTLQIGQRVALHTSFIPNDRVSLFFSACDIVAQPYRTATQSGVTQIAYHFAKPMLVTDVGGLAEIVPHDAVGQQPSPDSAGYVVAPAATAIADALADFYQNDREDTFIRGAAHEASKYSWPRLTEALMGLAD